MSGARFHSLLNALWYGPVPWGWGLAPLSLAFAGTVWLRRAAYRAGVLPVHRVGVPVVVVGNLTVGGTGKTPLVIWLARMLARRGYRPGVAVSGYGGRAASWPQQVRSDSDPEMTGDEAVLVARQTGLPVAAGPDRVATARALVRHAGCDVIVCDDGLQHLRLGRDVEIVVVDGLRRNGNGLCLPGGPLREPAGRARRVDAVVVNGVPRRGEIAMELVPGPLQGVAEPARTRRVEEMRGVPVHAVAGIGNPDRFFEMLRNLGLTIRTHPFPDHHRFRARDLAFGDRYPVVMTEKDAVKCGRIANERCWYLPVVAAPGGRLESIVLERLQRASRSGQSRRERGEAGDG